MTAPNWTPERDAALREAWLAGYSKDRMRAYIGSVSHQLPAPSHAVIYRRVEVLGLPPRSNKGRKALARRIEKGTAPKPMAQPLMAPTPKPPEPRRPSVDVSMDAALTKAREMVAKLKSLRDLDDDVVRRIAKESGLTRFCTQLNNGHAPAFAWVRRLVGDEREARYARRAA